MNTILHHVGMIWIIENHEELKYDIDILNSDWLTGGPWYESFQLQMGFSLPFLRTKDLRSYLLNIRARSFLLSCT